MQEMREIAFDLGTPGSGIGDIRLDFEGLNLKLEYEYTNNGDFVGSVIFANSSAFRFRDELRSKGYAEGSYDAVVRIRHSSWLEDLREIDSSGKDEIRELSHFAVFLSSNGYLEVIAENARLGVPRKGNLSG